MMTKYTIAFFTLLLCSCEKELPNEPITKPDDNRFTKVVLTQGMDEPMEMTFLPQGRILFVERKGAVKILDEESGIVTLAGTIAVNTKYTNKEGQVREAEEGLMGVIADPNYADNHWIYLYYADPEIAEHLLTRWELKGFALIPESEKILLRIPTQREECCHTGGGMVFDADGNLYLTVGNNTVNPRSGASNLDERPGHENSDDQRGPSNTNDFRGKILRIHPEDDGTYTIPEGNLFPPNLEKTLPEIYTMGHRNPWRPTIDSKTGYLYWGEVGPDAYRDSIWGPNGYDEFNQARGPGFFGWPYFIANNQAYNRFDAETGTYGTAYDPLNPINESVNNTGLKELPKPIPAFIYYPYGPSKEFPLLGSAGRSATGGPVFRKADHENALRPFSDYYEGKWIIVDFMRDWIIAVSMDEGGNYLGMEKIMPQERFNAVIDMDFGPSGDLYLLEYGDAWFKRNANARIVKIEYNAGNRKPQIEISADKLAGAVPLTVQLSSAGTIDYDLGDSESLTYNWTVASDHGYNFTSKEKNPSVTFDTEGIYEVKLSVIDQMGASNELGLQIIAGNEPPSVAIELKDANQTFNFGNTPLDYSITVSDQEDGTSARGEIEAGEVAVTFDYVPMGYDPIEAAQNHLGADATVADAISRQLIAINDCESCHQFDTASIGPSYRTVAAKYPNTEETIKMLSDRIINGSTGFWGDHAMSAHPELTDEEAARMSRYILSYLDPKPSVKNLPLTGSIKPQIPKGEVGEGSYILRASYQDKGKGTIPSIAGESLLTLRSPRLKPQDANHQKNVQFLTTPSTNFFALGPKAELAYHQLDLTNISQIEFFVQAQPRLRAKGGYIEIRLDAPDGVLIGKTEMIAPRNIPRFRPDKSEKISYEERRRKTTLQGLVNLEPTTGLHDVYFIVQNADADAVDILLSIREIEFYQAKQPPQ